MCSSAAKQKARFHEDRDYTAKISIMELNGQNIQRLNNVRRHALKRSDHDGQTVVTLQRE
jgi:hypothetical protein